MDKPDYEYTPGEWVVGTDGLNVGQDMLTITSPEYRKECDANHVVAYILTRGSRKMSAANASLVAAAPELLTALRHAVNALNTVPRFECGVSHSYAVAAMCDAAIAKAEGGD